jgi:hypothetical protein
VLEWHKPLFVALCRSAFGKTLHNSARGEIQMATLDKIQFRCSNCAKTVGVAVQFAGKRGKCPYCNAVVQIPAVEAATANPLRLASTQIRDLNSGEFEVRVNAMAKLREGKDATAIGQLIELLSDKDRRIREEAAFTLESIGDLRAVEPLIAVLSDLDGNVRLKAARALGVLGDSRAVEALIVHLRDPDYVVVFYAAQALGNIGDRSALEPLQAALSNASESEVRTALEQAIAALNLQPRDRKALDQENAKQFNQADDWQQLLAYVRDDRPADISGIKDATIFANVMRYYEVIVSDATCPKLVYYALKAKKLGETFPYLVVETGDRLEHDKAWHFDYEPMLKRALPGKSWNDITRDGYANFSKPGCHLASTAPFDRLATAISQGKYSLHRVLRACLSKPGTPANTNGFDELLQRYMSDAAFCEQLGTNFDAAVDEFNLSADEKRLVREHIEKVAPQIKGHASRVFNDVMRTYGDLF